MARPTAPQRRKLVKIVVEDMDYSRVSMIGVEFNAGSKSNTLSWHFERGMSPGEVAFGLEAFASRIRVFADLGEGKRKGAR